METIYLKIKIKKINKETDQIRNEGLFFENIANAISIDRKQIIEIDNSNYKSEINRIQSKFNKNDKSRGNKKNS